ncbi:hypothetical protein A0H76_1910 [Hepatospora eriocheir]|uniref:Uncharacterized protein n=1 Tax=Hepatospora eriocheir TaxID=1081669 RepID=A0A1X0QG99_9MICR|nr:hypothetical protein A0H76_1910 [Hepatospora eriocheir]
MKLSLINLLAIGCTFEEVRPRYDYLMEQVKDSLEKVSNNSKIKIKTITNEVVTNLKRISVNNLTFIYNQLKFINERLLKIVNEKLINNENLKSIKNNINKYLSKTKSIKFDDVKRFVKYYHDKFIFGYRYLNLKIVAKFKGDDIKYKKYSLEEYYKELNRLKKISINRKNKNEEL